MRAAGVLYTGVMMLYAGVMMLYTSVYMYTYRKSYVHRRTFMYVRQ